MGLFISMSTVLASTTLFVEPSQIYAQFDPFSSIICAGLPVSAITASADDGVNIPSSAIDRNINTRWSNLGLKSWIQVDLGQVNTICSLGVNWHRGNERVNSFVISVSTDGNVFTNVFSGNSDGGSLTEQNYNFQAKTGRFVRVTVTGNTQNNWVSIAELKIYGHKFFESDPGSCIKSPILEITAPNVQAYPPPNVVDNNFATIWSNYGVGSSIEFDLATSKSICSVDIAWFKGNERQSNFVISTSLDG